MSSAVDILEDVTRGEKRRVDSGESTPIGTYFYTIPTNTLAARCVASSLVDALRRRVCLHEWPAPLPSFVPTGAGRLGAEEKPLRSRNWTRRGWSSGPTQSQLPSSRPCGTPSSKPGSSAGRMDLHPDFRDLLSALADTNAEHGRRGRLGRRLPRRAALAKRRPRPVHRSIRREPGGRGTRAHAVLEPRGRFSMLLREGDRRDLKLLEGRAD